MSVIIAFNERRRRRVLEVVAQKWRRRRQVKRLFVKRLSFISSFPRYRVSFKFQKRTWILSRLGIMCPSFKWSLRQNIIKTATKHWRRTLLEDNNYKLIVKVTLLGFTKLVTLKWTQNKLLKLIRKLFAMIFQQTQAA